VVTGPEDRNDQPYVTVLRDPKSRCFGMWYNASGDERQHNLFALGYLESDDGIRWQRPHRLLQGPPGMRWGASVVDDGIEFADLGRRFKLAWWQKGGLHLAFSKDGLSWEPLAPGAVLKHDHDINCLFRDPIRKRYLAMVSSYTTGPTWSGKRRVTLTSVSDDLLHWKKPWRVFAPDDRQDSGETQFYCMGGLLARGQMLIGMLKVLRDDLPADPGGKVAGIGYTALAWSHDGEYWERDREPFLDRNPQAGAWDHAMAWADCQLLVGDKLHVYYGGYARGHKIERFTERQIGLVRTDRDRYVARAAGHKLGTLQTRVVRFNAESMSLNVAAAQGTARVEVTTADGKPIPGFRLEDCEPIRGGGVALAAHWKRPLRDLNGQDVRFTFSLRDAILFAFDLH
jgi:hypothetical protein